MMQDDQLPLVDAIDDERFRQAFEEHEVNFGADDDASSILRQLRCGHLSRRCSSRKKCEVVRQPSLVLHRCGQRWEDASATPTQGLIVEPA